jgi:hypothetical protein
VGIPIKEKFEGEEIMSTMPVVNPEPSAAPETKAKAEKKSASPQAANKYVEARLAKKKQRRRAHRLTIRRSNTGG